MNYRTKPGVYLVMLIVLGLQLLPVSSSQAWFGNSQCKKAIVSANKAVGDNYPVLTQIIVNNKKCFNPTVVANAQICARLDYGSSTLKFLQSELACTKLPKKFK